MAELFNEGAAFKAMIHRKEKKEIRRPVNIVHHC